MWGVGWVLSGLGNAVFPGALEFAGPLVLGAGFFLMVGVPCGFRWIESNPLWRGIRNAFFLMAGVACFVYLLIRLVL